MENLFSLTDYLDLYKVERATLLNERGTTDSDHEFIATTWSLSFKKIEQDSPASANDYGSVHLYIQMKFLWRLLRVAQTKLVPFFNLSL